MGHGGKSGKGGGRAGGTGPTAKSHARQAADRTRTSRKKHLSGAVSASRAATLPRPPALTRRTAVQHLPAPAPARVSWVTRAARLVPGAQVLRAYPRAWLRADVFAGAAVAAYLVPQVMAYAAIVGVPPVVGLWTALAALLAYAVLGSSRMLSVGPESTVALLAGATIAPMAAGDPVRAEALTSALCFVVAGWCLLARLARLGVAADLLSHPLLIGYLAGGAVLMVVGQLGRITGTTVSGESIVSQVESFVGVVGDTHMLTLAVAVGTFTVLVAVHVLRPTWPAPLIAVAAATAACAIGDLHAHGVAVLGAVPSGLPGVHLPAVGVGDLRSLFVAGLGVAVVAYGDNMLISRGFAATTTQADEPTPVDTPESASGAVAAPEPEAGDKDESHAEADPQQELLALAGVHVATGLVGGFPVSSSGSRTALALAGGARSQGYSLVAACAVVGVLFAAGPLLRNLPAAALGAVVVYAASKLVDIGELVRLARFRVTELVLALVTLVGTVAFGILAGVGLAVALSLLEMAQRLARPHEGVLGRVPGLAGMHDVDDYANAETLPGLVVYRYDAPLFFANVGDLRRKALSVVDTENALDRRHPVRWFVLNVEANVEIDITAADGLRGLHEDLVRRGVRLGLARVKHDLHMPLERAGLVELIGEEMLFLTLPVAEEAYLRFAEAELTNAGPRPAPPGGAG